MSQTAISLPAVSAANFNEVVLQAPADRLVAVDFWAGWCGPCKALAPILESVAREREGVVMIAKVDTDAHPELAAEWKVRALPTIAIFRNGTEVGRMVGLRSAADIVAEIDRLAAAQ